MIERYLDVTAGRTLVITIKELNDLTRYYTGLCIYFLIYSPMSQTPTGIVRITGFVKSNALLI